MSSNDSKLDITWNVDGVEKKVLFESSEAVKQFLERITHDAKKEAPVRGAYRSFWTPEEMHQNTPGITGGTLRDSITFDFKESTIEGRVYTQTGYGGYVEIGTRKMPARPFIKPAFDLNRDKLLDDLKDSI